MNPCNVVKLVFKPFRIIKLRKPQEATEELKGRFNQINEKLSQLLKDGELSGLQSYKPSAIKNYESLIYENKFLYLKIDLSTDKKQIVAEVDDVIGEAQKQFGTHTGEGTRRGAAQRDKAKKIYLRLLRYIVINDLTLEEACVKTADDFEMEADNIKRRYLLELKKKIIPDLQKMFPGEKINSWSEIQSRLKSLADIPSLSKQDI